MWAKTIVCLWLSSACAGGALVNTDTTMTRECDVDRCAGGGRETDYTLPVVLIAAMISIPAVIHHQFR